MGLTFSCKTAKNLAVKIDKFQPLVVKKGNREKRNSGENNGQMFTVH